MGGVVTAGPCHRWRSPSDHTCESFGPRLFIWFSLSAASVSSAHLCPLYKKKIHPHPHKPPPKTTRPSGRYTDFLMTNNQIGAKLTQGTPSTPLFLQAVHVQKTHRDSTQRSDSKKEARRCRGVLCLLLFIHLKGKPHFLQFCVYFCLLLPTQKTKLPSINLSDPSDYL